MPLTPVEPAKPFAEPRCPLCGGPNGCTPAATGSFGGEPCWCREVSFSAEVLARVPPALRGKACLCRRCATGNGEAAAP